jgi:hypothetical protein
MTRESNEPTQFQLSVKINNQPVPGHNSFPLDFKQQTELSFNSDEFGKFSQAGYVKNRP